MLNGASQLHFLLRDYIKTCKTDSMEITERIVTRKWINPTDFFYSETYNYLVKQLVLHKKCLKPIFRRYNTQSFPEEVAAPSGGSTPSTFPYYIGEEDSNEAINMMITSNNCYPFWSEVGGPLWWGGGGLENSDWVAILHARVTAPFLVHYSNLWTIR
jgi:hypothetical protein